jgi:hypothetical protein
MPRAVNLDFSMSVPQNFNFSSIAAAAPTTPRHFFESGSPIPAKLPSCVHADDKGLIAGDWTHCLKRCFIPAFASTQDKKVSEFFIHYFKNFFECESPTDKGKVGAMLSLAEQHIARHQGWFPWESVGSDIARLERYTFGVRQHLNRFDSSESKQSLIRKCRIDNRALLARWTKSGFSEEAFWGHPDLVDFIFRSHLHRHINHPYYKHTISMQNCLVRREGQVTALKEPHLLLDGRLAPWSEIRKKIHIDSQSRLFSRENGQKSRWTYLEQGLTRLNEDHFASPQRLRKLECAPPRCKVQVITTHAHPEDWNLADRVFEGTRHSFFRIIPGEGFSVRHPEMGLDQGGVYSFGWGTTWRDFDLFSPLSTLKGKWFSPDDWEFLKQDHCITSMDVTDAQVIKLMEVIRRRSREDLPFHFITANCCGITAEVLNEAGILDLCTKNHMARLGYEFLIPKWIRTPIDKIGSLLDPITPSFVVKAVHRVGAFFHSVIFAPFFTLLGAWRVNISYEDEEGEISQQAMLRARAANRIKAIFSDVFDLFRPSKMEFDMTKNIYKWQKHQPETVFEKHD